MIDADLSRFDPIFARHKCAVLQFSGGKDSLACLHLLRPYWDRLTVLWCDTGDAFPETYAQMLAIAQLVPSFRSVRSDQPAQIEEYGPPADLVPVWNTPLGRAVDSQRKTRVQTPFGCCSANIWGPMYAAVKTLGATLVIRGQRESERLKAPIHSGITGDGIEYLFPIEDWSEAQVREFLSDRKVALPETYGWFNTSGDCLTCTAFLEDSRGKIKYLRERHPSAHIVVVNRLRGIAEAAYDELQAIAKAAVTA